jgi:hypothetical protein
VIQVHIAVRVGEVWIGGGRTVGRVADGPSGLDERLACYVAQLVRSGGGVVREGPALDAGYGEAIDEIMPG